MKGPPRRPSEALARWRESAAWRAIATASVRRINAGPKCEARTRTTGEPCRAAAMENGRCYRHGGRTPKGAAWHKPTFPVDGKRFYGKLGDLQRRKAKQDRRREAMTPEERERHERWRQTHAPGPNAARAATRETRRQNAEARALFASRRETAPNPEVVALEALEKELLQLLNEAEQREREKQLMKDLFG
jgi:hypothetical protein